MVSVASIWKLSQYRRKGIRAYVHGLVRQRVPFELLLRDCSKAGEFRKRLGGRGFAITYDSSRTHIGDNKSQLG